MQPWPTFHLDTNGWRGVVTDVETWREAVRQLQNGHQWTLFALIEGGVVHRTLGDSTPPRFNAQVHTAGETLSAWGLENRVDLLLELGPDFLHPCCFPSERGSRAEELYCAYNRAGLRKGLNYQGEPCPLWSELPFDVQWKWRAATTITLSTRIPEG